MFREEHLTSLFDELNGAWKGKPEYEELIRDAHVGIALVDAGRALADDLSPVVTALIEKHKPQD